MSCEYCELIKKGNLLYEDDEIAVAVKEKAIIPGQIVVFPKEHFTILEMVPDEILQKCVTVANKVSMAAFESLGSKGTNIIVKNGLGAGQNIPHFAVEVVPRQEGDGLDLQWAPKQLMEDEMEMAFNLLKEELEKPSGEPKEDVEVEGIKEEQAQDDYRLKAIKRIP